MCQKKLRDEKKKEKDFVHLSKSLGGLYFASGSIVKDFACEVRVYTVVAARDGHPVLIIYLCLWAHIWAVVTLVLREEGRVVTQVLDEARRVELRVLSCVLNLSVEVCF